ncbi:MAG: hypothetical protein JST04_02390 [Bdellovibrionales bacterium]|nr:hypothetical protein [Bdellovibrionales bacterium]
MGSPKGTAKTTTKSTGNRTVRRYRINPLELVIFSLVSAGFAFSVFHLFRDNDEIQFATLQPMQTSPTRMVPGQTSNRGIASVAGAVDGVAPVANPINFEVNCAENPGFQFGNQVCPNEPVKGRNFRDTAKFNPAKLR